MKPIAKKVLTLVVCLAIVATAVGISRKLVAGRAKPEKSARIDHGVLVSTFTAERKAHRLDIKANGTVRAARETVVFPEINGRLTSLHEQLSPGGLLKKGDVLFRIQAKDWRLAVEESNTAVDQAQAMLEVEQGQQKIAAREWELFEKDAGGANVDSSLALRKPQMKSAKVGVRAAQARLDRARSNLSKTSVRAPFDALVRNESAEVGLLVGPQSRIATLVGTDAYWVQISLPVEQLPYLTIPGTSGPEGSKVTVSQDLGGKRLTWQGQVLRLLPDLDPAGRMARVLIEVRDPLGLEKEGPRGMPLLLDSYVEVEVLGSRVEELVAVPRNAIRDGDKVYLYVDGHLVIRDVTVAWRRKDDVLVSKGLETGDVLVVTRIPAPVEGLKLRTKKSEQPVAAARKTDAGDKPAADKLAKKDEEAGDE